ncbi:MAG: multidrug effflux MFS transporter [Pseudomonadota bacterium]
MPRQITIQERIALLALLICLPALAIDAMLPALPEIGRDLDLADANRAQLIIIAFVIGLGIGQLFYGPLSDSFGRRLPIQVGLAVFLIGSLICLFAETFVAMLAGRALQGVGAAGPRTVAVALVRDNFSGAQMARIMSFVMAVFITVPALAPFVGQVVQTLAGWRMIFTVFLVMATVALVWFTLRHPETHPPEKRRALSPANLAADARTTLSDKTTLSYTIATGFIFAGFFGYITSAQQVFVTTYGKGAAFPGYFAVLAFAIGTASIFNARYVTRFGERRLAHVALTALCLSAGAGFLIEWVDLALLPFPLFYTVMFGIMCAFGVLFGNMNAIAMAPMGRIAGIASAIIASVSAIIAGVGGAIIGQAYDGTTLPLFAGFLVCSLAAAVVITFGHAAPQTQETPTP